MNSPPEVFGSGGRSQTTSNTPDTDTKAPHSKEYGACRLFWGDAGAAKSIVANTAVKNSLAFRRPSIAELRPASEDSAAPVDEDSDFKYKIAIFATILCLEKPGLKFQS